MPRPQIFASGNRKTLNVYLHKPQYEWLQREARQRSKISPSAYLRKLIDEKIKEAQR